MALSNDICPSVDNERRVTDVKATVRNKKNNTYLVKGIFLSNKLESLNASR